MVNLVIPVVTAPFITRVLSLEGFGTYSLLQVIGVYLSAVMDFGLTSYGTREVAKTSGGPEVVALWEISCAARLSLCLLAFPITLIASLLLAKHLSLWVVLSFFLLAWGNALNSLWLLNGLGHTASYSVPFLFIRLISVVLIVLTAYIFKNIDLIFLTYSIGIFAANLGTFLVARKYMGKFSPRPKYNQLAHYFRVSWPFAYSGFLGLFLNSSIVVFSGVVLGAQVAAGVSVSDRIVKGLLALASPFTISLFPGVSAGFAESHLIGARKIFRYGAPFLMGYGLLCLVVFFLRYPILEIFGSRYFSFAPTLSLLLLWSWVSVLNNFLAMQYMLASGREGIYARLFAVSAVVSVLGYFFLPQVLGELGIPTAALVGEGIVTLGATLLILRDVQARRFSV